MLLSDIAPNIRKNIWEKMNHSFSSYSMQKSL